MTPAVSKWSQGGSSCEWYGEVGEGWKESRNAPTRCGRSHLNSLLFTSSPLYSTVLTSTHLYSPVITRTHQYSSFPTWSHLYLNRLNSGTRMSCNSSHFPRCSHASSKYVSYPITALVALGGDRRHACMPWCIAPKYLVCVTEFTLVPVIVDEYAWGGCEGLLWQIKGADWLASNWIPHHTIRCCSALRH